MKKSMKDRIAERFRKRQIERMEKDRLRNSPEYQPKVPDDR